MIAVMIAGAMRHGRLAGRHSLPHHVLPQPRQGPTDPRQGGSRPRPPHAQARHADDGRPGHRRGRLLRLGRCPLPSRARLLQPGSHRLGRHPGAVRASAFSTTTSRSTRRTTAASSGRRRATSRWPSRWGSRGGWSRPPVSARRSRSPATTGPAGTCRGRSGSCSPGSPSGARRTPSTSPTASTASLPASALLGFLAFTIIAYWAFRNPEIYGVDGPGRRQPARPCCAGRGVRRRVWRVPVVQRGTRRASSWVTWVRWRSVPPWHCWR